MDKWKCSVCGYIYDPAKGDPFKALPGTDFVDPPDDWNCPICGVTKNKHVPATPDIDTIKRRAQKRK